MRGMVVTGEYLVQKTVRRKLEPLVKGSKSHSRSVSRQTASKYGSSCNVS